MQCHFHIFKVKPSKDGANTDNRMIKKINRERKIERQYAMKIKNKATRITV